MDFYFLFFGHCTIILGVFVFVGINGCTDVYYHVGHPARRWYVTRRESSRRPCLALSCPDDSLWQATILLIDRRFAVLFLIYLVI